MLPPGDLASCTAEVLVGGAALFELQVSSSREFVFSRTGLSIRVPVVLAYFAGPLLAEPVLPFCPDDPFVLPPVVPCTFPFAISASPS